MCTETVAWRVGFSMSTRRLNRIEWLTKGLKSPWPPPAIASCGCRTGRRTHRAGHRAHRAGQPRPRWAADLVCMGGIWLCTADCTISMMMRRGSLTNWLCPPNRAYLIRSSSVYIRGYQTLDERRNRDREIEHFPSFSMFFRIFKFHTIMHIWSEAAQCILGGVKSTILEPRKYGHSTKA